MSANAPMTAAEKACCRMMRNHCGDMEMPATHTCCQKDSGGDRDHALQARQVALHPVVFTLNALAADALSANAPRSAHRPDEVRRAPPESPPASVSILRL